MKKLSLLAALGILAASAPAIAGLHTFNIVQINPTTRYATGALGTAYNSNDTYQRIICTVSAYRTSSGTDEYAQCFATSSSNVQVSCVSYDPLLITNARAIGDESLVSFTWNTSGECDQITVTKGSQFETKRPPT